MTSVSTELVETRRIDQMPAIAAVTDDLLVPMAAPDGSAAGQASLARIFRKYAAIDVVYETNALLAADLDHEENSLALVFADPDPSLSRYYYKVGASGTGSWQPSTLGQGATGAAGAANNTYSSLSTLKAAPITDLSYTLIVNGVAREYTYKEGDYSSTPSEGLDTIVIKQDDTALTVGAFVLKYDALEPEFFGDVGDGISIDATPTLEKWKSYAIATGARRVAAHGAYYVPAGVDDLKLWAIAQGDPTFDLPLHYGIIFNGAEDMEVDLRGALFTTDYGSPIVLYRSYRTNVLGGEFVATSSPETIASEQPSAVTITRSLDCEGIGQVVTGFHRNLFVYRAPNCGFSKFTSEDATYYCAYGASVLDVALTGAPSQTFHHLNDGYAKGGKYGNFFMDNTEACRNRSVDCAPDGNNAAHFKTEKMNFRCLDNEIYESSVQNSGDIIDGISAVPATAYGISPHAVISRNKVRGCYRSIFARGLTSFQIALNDVKGYYQTGIALVTDNISATDLDLRRGIIALNDIGAMADNSTRSHVGNDKNCGLQIEKNTATLFELIVSNNTVDAKGDNVTKTPSFNMYVECDEDAVTGLSSNTLVGSLPNNLPTWFYRNDRTPRTKIIPASSGTAAAPVAIASNLYRDGVARCYNSYIELPDAVKDLKITFTSSSATNRIYVKGASSGATGSDTINVPGVGTATRNITFSGPGAVTFVCTVAGNWDAIPAGGTTPAVFS